MQAVTPENLSEILSGPEHVWMERRRRAQMLSEGLILSLQIKATDKGLAAWLMGPDDRRVTNNRDAVFLWVLQQMDVPGQDEEPEIEQLKARLRDTIDDLMDCE